MFTEWTDPHDIDHYYDDVGKLYNAVAEYQKPVSKPIEAPIVETKSTFEVRPNTILSDGHPVGSQPEYNILRSGPAVYATAQNKKSSFTQPLYIEDIRGSSSYDINMIILWILIGMMFVHIIKLHTTIESNRFMFYRISEQMREFRNRNTQ